MVPLFRGLGYSIVVICCVSELYYAVICGWSFFYLFAGMQRELPWLSCADGEDWHTPDCYTREIGISCRANFMNYKDCDNSTACIWYNGTCTNMFNYCIGHGYTDGFDAGTTVEEVNYICIINDNHTSKSI